MKSITTSSLCFNKLGVALALTASFCSHLLSQAQKLKPNILWITIEDTSPQFIGCYGNKDARTPNIDDLASSGIRFSNAFACGSVSSASRSCLITGVKTYNTGTGNHRSNYPIPDYIKGFPFFMKKEGYYTSNNSKTDYNILNEKDFIKETWNESSDKAGWWNRKPGQPFFAVFNFMESHQSRTMTESYDWYLKKVIDALPLKDRIGDNEFQMPPIYYDSPEMRKQFARVYNSIKLMDNRVGELLEKLSKDHLRDSTIIFFFADHGEGEPRGKTNGINLSYRVPFVIWIPEMYKELSPWGKSGIVTDELIDFHDLAPTLISLAGGKVPEYLKGRVLMGENRTKETDHLILSSDRSDNGIDLIRNVTNGKFIYSRNFMPFMPELRYIQYMEIGEIKQQMRKDLADNKLNPLQRSLFEDRPTEFLYNIENDLWETKNLVNDKAYKSILDKMRNQLKNEMLQSRDIMLLPEYEIAIISKTKPPYEYRLDDKNFPITEIYKAAELSGIRSAEVAKQQISMLTNSNKIVRYWAILGLRSQPSALLKPYSKQLLKAMEDTYPPVAAIASAVYYQQFKSKLAKDNLKKFCISENSEISLMTINLLIYEKNKQPFVETIQSVQKLRKGNRPIPEACEDFLRSVNQ